MPSQDYIRNGHVGDTVYESGGDGEDIGTINTIHKSRAMNVVIICLPDDDEIAHNET